MPAQKMPCASANTSTRIAPEHGRKPTATIAVEAALPAAGTGELIRRRPVRMAAVLVMQWPPRRAPDCCDDARDRDDDARGHDRDVVMRGHDRDDGVRSVAAAPTLFGARSGAQFAQERPALHPEEPRAHQRRSARSSRSRSTTPRVLIVLRRSRRAAPPRCRRARPRPCACSSAEREREHDAALPGLLVGDEIGRDHRLAVAGAGGVEHPVGEREAHQQPRRRCRRSWRCGSCRRACGRIRPAWRAASPRCRRRQAAAAAAARRRAERILRECVGRAA